MRLLELRLQNFRQHAHTRIHFPSGLTGIIGPNGAGKSTLLEAIAWAIYGAEAARGTNETLRHARARPNARVEVELRFLLAEHEYRVTRTLSTAEVREDGSPIAAAGSLGGATEFLQRRLGMARKEFFNTYFTSQKELQFLASMGPTERGRFLSTVLGYDRLRVAQELARRQRNLLRGRLEALRRDLPEEDAVRAVRRAAEEERTAARSAAEAADGAMERARRAQEQLAPRWSEAQRARERHAQLTAALAAAESEAEAARAEADRIGEQLGRILAARAEQEQLRRALEPLSALEQRCQRLDALAGVHERRRALAEQVEEIEVELDRSLGRLRRLEQAPELLRRYAGELASARAAHGAVGRELEGRKTAWLRDRQDAETKLQGYRDRALELQEEVGRIRSAGPDGICPTCQRPLGADFERLLGSLEEQWAEVKQDGTWWRSRHDQLAGKPTELVELEERLRELEGVVEDTARKHTRCEAALHELETLREERGARESRQQELREELEALPQGYDAAEHRSARAELEELRRAERRVVALEELTRRTQEWEESRDEANGRLAGATARAADLRSERMALSFAVETYEALREAAEAAEREARLVELESTAARERLRGAERAAESAARAERELDERLAAIGREVGELRHHSELDSAFTRLRADLNARVRPELGEIASQLLAQLTDGRYTALEIDPAYRIVVRQDGEAKPVISGGEEDVANLVLRISLSQMIVERAGHPLSLLILDEVFGSLDVARRENVVRLLRRLGDRFEQVVLVTHLEEIRGALDQVLRVDLDEATGASVVRWEDGRVKSEG